MFAVIGAIIGVAITAATTGLRAAVGDPGLTVVPCANQLWRPDDPQFTALPGARAVFGAYEGGLYRIELPIAWSGELVLWAHGFVDERSQDGSRLRVGFPAAGQVGQGSTLREHLIAKGFAWAASSYRCNGYVPGVGLSDTIALIDVFTRSSAGRAPTRIYLAGSSMGGHTTILGLQEFPSQFAGGLAMCAAGPGQMEFLTAVAAASELITGVTASDTMSDEDNAKLSAIVGIPPAYTDKGRQLADLQIAISGGPRPFASEGLALRFTQNVEAGARVFTQPEWNRAALNASLRYSVTDTFGVTAEAITGRIRRRATDSDTRSSLASYEETIPFDGRIERPLMTLHGTGDLFVPISLERSLRRAVNSSGRSELLVQRIMRIPGHCGFSRTEQTRAFDDLVTWVRDGVRPDGDDVLADLNRAGMRFTDPLRPGDPSIRKP